jgi:carboxymethylenebutenolidase
MFGREEPATPAPAVSRLGAALASSSSVFTQLVSYPDVAGRFYRDDRETVAHAAAYDSWQRVVEWLDARVVPRPTPLAEAWLLRQLVGR